MPKNKLFDDNDSEEDTVLIKTNSEYAKRYDNWREKEELHKLEQKYEGKDLDAPISSDSEDEDEEPPEIPEEIEAQFLKTLSLLKTKDPRIYDPEFKFFDEVKEGKEQKEEKTEDTLKPKKEVNSLAAAFADSDNDEENDGEIFKVEKKAPQPAKPGKEAKIKEYLKRKVDHVDPNEEQDLAPLRALWSDPKLNQDEAFLRDYILNKRYLEPDSSGGAGKLLDSAALAADEELVEEQGRFERAYNFRFEEPDQEYLKRYPRTMSSIRPKDDSRSKKRSEVRTRKEEEKQRKMEEIARLKALKLKEIQEKLAKIKEVTGNEELAFKDEDIEGDFDPAEHDRRMRAIFDEEYYGEADDEKPVFPDLDEELEIENWENYEGVGDEERPAGDEGAHCEDEDFNMDADYDPKKARTTLLEEIKETLGKKRRNRKRKSKLAKILETEKPKFVPTVIDKTYDQYMEEYYKMDCEDVIGGDLPTRFKYRETVPNSFGLTIEEILLADDKELNKWASLKKTVKHRPEQVEKSEVKTYAAKSADIQLKKKLLPSLFKDLPEEPEVVVPIEDKKKKKKRNKNKTKTSEKGLKEKNEVDDNTESQGQDDSSKIQELTKTVKEVTKKKKPKQVEQLIKNSNSDAVIDRNKNNKQETKAVVVALNKTVENLNKNTKNKRQCGNVTQGKQNSSGVEDKESKKNVQTIIKEKSTEIKNELSNLSVASSESKKKKNKNKVEEGKSEGQNNLKKERPQVQNVNNLKRKLDEGHKDGPNNKKNKFNKPNKQFKNIKQSNKQDKLKPEKKKGKEDMMSKLSDERLKAYGLNPKKYRSFLKYKKF